MPPKTAPTSASREHNTRFASKRRPVAMPDNRQKSKPKTIDEASVLSTDGPPTTEEKKHVETADTSLEEKTVIAVIPSFWVKDVAPLVTEDSDEVEKYVAQFQDNVDYEIVSDIDKQLADVLVKESVNAHETIDDKPVHYCVFPSPGADKAPFITCNPRIAREMTEEDPTGTVIGKLTLAKAKMMLEKYVAAFKAELTKAALLHPSAQESDTESCPGDDQNKHGHALVPDCTDRVIDAADVGLEEKQKAELAVSKAVQNCITSYSCIGTDKTTTDILANTNVNEEHTKSLDDTLDTSADPYTTPEKNKFFSTFDGSSPPPPPDQKRFGTMVRNASFHPSFTPEPLAAASADEKKSGGLADSNSPGQNKKVVTYELSLVDPASPLSTASKQPCAKKDVSPGSRPSLEEIIDQRRRKSSQALERTGFDSMLEYFVPVTGKQDYAVISVQLVRSSDASHAHWLMKWFLMASVLQETVPEHESSRTWFKTVTACRIRNLPYGSNIEKTNGNQYPIHQAYGLVPAGQDMQNVCKNLGADIKRACASASVQTAYKGLLKTHFPKVFAKMKEQETRAGKEKAQKSFWDEVSESTVKTKQCRSLDATFLDQEIDEICNVLFEPNTTEHPWPNEIRFACYRSGKLPYGT